MNRPIKKDKQQNKQIEGSRFREEVHSKVVRAGRRTYFFDVKATRRNEYYLTITESKKQSEQNEPAFYEKHKIFLYKEDFKRFAEGLKEILDYIEENQPDIESEEENDESYALSDFSDIDFEDLSK